MRARSSGRLSGGLSGCSGAGGSAGSGSDFVAATVATGGVSASIYDFNFRLLRTSLHIG